MAFIVQQILCRAMNVFHCNHCQQLVFFESTQCVRCGHTLAFLTDLKVIGSLESVDKGLWASPASQPKKTYRLCDNYTGQTVSNWPTPATETHTLCESCRLTRVVPDLTREGVREAWYKLEMAKRRLVYTLRQLGCFVKS